LPFAMTVALDFADHLVPMMRIERMTSPLPRECSTTELHGPNSFVERVKGIEPSS
jgi:hypothetical protein